MIQIFNKIIFGSDADAFLALDINAKCNWIKKYTNQQNDDLINEFLTNLPMYKSQGENCIGCKLSNDGKNISKTNAVEVATSSEPTMVAKSVERTNTKARKRNKTN